MNASFIQYGTKDTPYRCHDTSWPANCRQLLRKPQLILSQPQQRALSAAVSASTTIPSDIYDSLNRLVAAETGFDISLAELRSVCDMYQSSYDIGACFAMRPTVAYGGEPQFAVVATELIAKGTMLKGVSGVIVPLEDGSCPPTPSTTRSLLKTRDGSGSARLLGPISRINHECIRPSGQLVTTGHLLGFKTLGLISIRETFEGEEITINYGTNYFATGQCLCAGCETRGQNGWRATSRPPLQRMGKTRKGSTTAWKQIMHQTVYSYASLPLSSTREPGDYTQYLSRLASERCLSCRALFVDIFPERLCANCIERLVLLPQPEETLTRYCWRLTHGETPLMLYSQGPLGDISSYLMTVSIPGWRMYPRPVRFNNRQHKERCLKTTHGDTYTRDLRQGASCDSAVAKGAAQFGQMWLVVGQWRPDGVEGIMKDPNPNHSLYMCVVLVRMRTVRLPVQHTCYSIAYSADVYNGSMPCRRPCKQFACSTQRSPESTSSPTLG